MTYYNEFDKGAAAWIRELQKEGVIANGTVDERSIREVQPGDVPARAHFFAGVGGWDFALQLAGWPAEWPVWTGSCPCQPFSAAGKRKGVEDERHLWPEFRRLIAERRPPIVFGEQVASADGRLWLAGVRADLEALGYAVGASDLCSAGVGAPNIRQRLYWVASAEGLRLEGWGDGSGRVEARPGGLLPAGPGDDVGGLGDAFCHRAERAGTGECVPYATGALGYWDAFDILPCLDGKARRIEPGSFPLVAGIPRGMGQGGYPGLPFDPQACAEGRVMRLRGYGNAINVQIAAEFISATMEAIGAV